MDTNRTRRTILIAIALFAGASTWTSTAPALEARSPRADRDLAPSSAKVPDKDAAARVREAYSGLPLRFERAADPGGEDAEFIARGAGYSLMLANSEARLVLGGTADGPRTSMTMRLLNASTAVHGRGRRVLPGTTNYLIGRNPREWRTGVRSYAEVEYLGVYPGVDLVYYGNQRQLEFDFIVAPGASYRAIAFAFGGATHLATDRAGNLLIETAAGTLVQRAPTIYQEKSGIRRAVRGGYVLGRDGRVGFDVRSYDPHLPLIIDPILTYSTYLGGDREERAAGVAFDAQGNMYVAGLTGAANFPATGSLANSHGRDNWDAFVVKLSASGDQFLYATYLGGSGYDEPADLAVDAAGNAYVAGQTDSWDFPTLNAMQSSLRGSSDSFVAKLDASGLITYSTYVGGGDRDAGSGIAVDALGRVYLAGFTSSGDFPKARAFQPSLGGHPAFRTTDGATWAGIGSGLNAGSFRMIAIDPVDTQTLYAGTGSDGVFKSTDGGSTWTATSADLPLLPANAMLVDRTGAVFVANDAGLYRSNDGGASWIDLLFGAPISALAVDPGSQTVYAGHLHGLLKSTDGGNTWSDTGLGQWVTSLAASQSVIYAGTANGVFKSIDGSNWAAAGAGIQEWVTAVAVDPGNPDVAYAGTTSALFYTTSGGSTWSTSIALPVVSVAVAPSNPSVVYLATLSGAGRSEDGGTTWQGTGPAGMNLFFFAIDPLVATRVYGAGGVGLDSFVSRISADGSHLDYSTFLGGAGAEWGTDIDVDSSGAAYVAGITQSTDFPVLNPYQASAGGLMDVFVAKISDAGALTYSTYLGGAGSDYAPGIAVDVSGQAHVVGVTLSADFPTANAFQPSHGGGFADVFVTTLNASGDGLVYSTFLGGSGQDAWQSSGPAVAVGPSGDAVVTGATMSSDFPTRDAIQSAHAGGGSDAFAASFDATGHLLYSTYLGGSGADYATRLSLDPAGAVVVAGATSSPDFSTQAPIQPANAGAEDVFIARLAPSTPADTTAPTTVVNTDGVHGSNGWFRSSVSVTLSAADDDDGSGVDFVEYSLNGGAFQHYTGPFLVAAEGTTVVRARATDRAGNIENPGASSTVMIDSVAPTITITSPAPTAYLHTGTLQVSFGATDPVSGLANPSPAAALDGLAVANGKAIQLLTLALGAHKLSLSVSDRAGNTSRKDVVFTVVATMDTLAAAVNTFIAQGQIDANMETSLLSKLEEAKDALSRGNLESARGQIGDFRNQVSALDGQSISAAAAQLLIGDAGYVLGTLQ